MKFHCLQDIGHCEEVLKNVDFSVQRGNLLLFNFHEITSLALQARNDGLFEETINSEIA
jgi:hypothetical protein